MSAGISSSWYTGEALQNLCPNAKFCSDAKFCPNVAHMQNFDQMKIFAQTCNNEKTFDI